MQLHISPSLRHVTVFPGKGVKEFIKVNVGSRRVSYRMLFYSLLFSTFLIRFVFLLTTVDDIDGDVKCSTIGNFLDFTLHLSFLSIYLFLSLIIFHISMYSTFKMKQPHL